SPALNSGRVNASVEDLAMIVLSRSKNAAAAITPRLRRGWLHRPDPRVPSLRPGPGPESGFLPRPGTRSFAAMSGGQVIGVRPFGDDLLGAIAPLGLAVAARTALVVDLVADGASYPAERTLPEVVAEGPRRAELVPERSGVAVLPN